MYTGQNIVRLAYGDRVIWPKPPKVKTLPIAYNITEAHSDFPIYIKPSSITGFGSLTLAEAQSLRFYADSAKTVELPREIVSADEIYVKNTLATGTGNKLYLDWDGTSSDYAVSDTYGARNVWNSNYKLSYHYNGNANDSTANALNGTGTSMSYSTGILGGGAVFATNGSRIQLPGNMFTNTSQQNRSYFFWIYPTDLSVLKYLYHNQMLDGKIIFSMDATKLYVNNNQDSSGSDGSATYPFSTNARYKVGFTINGTIVKLYINGELKGTYPWIRRTMSSGTEYANLIGCYAHSSLYPRSFRGTMGHSTISQTTLSDSRISTEYANQSNPDTFFGTLS